MTAPLDAGRATGEEHIEGIGTLTREQIAEHLWRANTELERSEAKAIHLHDELTALRARLDASERVRKAGVRVEKAITNEGRVPGYHRGVMHRHRVEWPTLWAELDALRTSLARVS